MRADTFTCVDCGKPAREWEHRDYLLPLMVKPVCHRCNQLRPTAYDSVYRPAGESNKPVFIRMPDLRAASNRERGLARRKAKARA